MIRDSLTMLCRDRLPRLSPEDTAGREQQKSAIDKLCWEMFSLQGRNLPFSVLLQKCEGVISRSPYEPIRRLRAEDVANEISSPSGGW